MTDQQQKPLPKWSEFNMITGAPGTGKSTLSDKVIKLSPKKNALILLKPVDLYRSMQKGEAFFDFPYLDNIYKYKGGKVKLSSDDIEIEILLALMAKSYRDGDFLLDEAGMYRLMWKNPDNGRTEPIPPLKEILKQRRKYNIGMNFTYHGVSEMPPQLMDYANNFILFHQSGEFRNKAVVPRYEEIVKMRNRIRAKYDAGNRYYCECLKLS